ncbi:hypothetical protein ACLOJK_016144 [Asimina triloba]
MERIAEEDEKEDEAESEELGKRPGGKRRGVGGARLLEDEVFVELTRRGPLAPLVLPAPRALLLRLVNQEKELPRELEGDDFLQDRDSFKETTERLVEAKKERLKEATTANAKEQRRDGGVEVGRCKMMVEMARLKELSLRMMDAIFDFTSACQRHHIVGSYMPPFPRSASETMRQSTGATSIRRTNGNERKVEMKENGIRRFTGMVGNTPMNMPPSAPDDEMMRIIKIELFYQLTSERWSEGAGGSDEFFGIGNIQPMPELNPYVGLQLLGTPSISQAEITAQQEA